jgi:peptidoglycan/xylan/chitin deacetylase (PgdA/CDA1 family)
VGGRVTHGALTIVMYHYVRDVARSAYPGIYALSVDGFIAQLDYLTAHYTVVSPDDLLAAIAGGRPLPANAALLTFDDGYRDHYDTVLPILRERKLSAAFFPVGMVLAERKVLAANKLHFVRSVLGDDRLAAEVYRLIDRYRETYGLQTSDHYRQAWRETGRLDSNEIRTVKTLLQKGLPEPARRHIVDELFATHVTADEAAFATELYMQDAEIRALRDRGMTIGNHGYGHGWLDHMTTDAVRADVAKAADYLDALGVTADNWIMCYPYGGHNETVRGIVHDLGAAAGLAVAFETADLGRDDPLALPRLDTNQLPQSAVADVRG